MRQRFVAPGARRGPLAAPSSQLPSGAHHPALLPLPTPGVAAIQASLPHEDTLYVADDVAQVAKLVLKVRQ